MKQIYEIKYNLEIGDQVFCKKTKRVGTVTRQWAKLKQLGNTLYLDFSYTVEPEKTSYNQWRSKEEDLQKLEAGEIPF